MSFKDIPDSRPYGFWLSPDLQLFIVPFEGHSKIASELVFKNKKLKIKYEEAMATADSEFDMITPMQFLESINFVRIVFDSRLKPNPKLYFEGKASSKQIKLIKDLGMFYDTPVVADNPELRQKRIQGFYESVSFANLPESGFYGFWVLPNGNIEIVQNFGKHGEIAKLIILNNSVLEERFTTHMVLNDSPEKVKSIPAMTFFEWFYTKFGAVRVVKENRYLRYSYAKPLTNSQKRTISDLADFYQIEKQGEPEIT